MYQENQYLKSQFPLDKYLNYFTENIYENLKKGNDFINPVLCAIENSITLNEAINFLISIASIKNNEIVRLGYVYECDECEKIEILNEEDLANYQCVYCSDESINIREMMEEGIIDLEICFEINSRLSRIIKQGFDLPSSKPMRIDLEEGEIHNISSVTITSEIINGDLIVGEETPWLRDHLSNINRVRNSPL